MRKRAPASLLIAVVLGLSGCGFHLPWVETKAEVKAKLAQSQADLRTATESLGAANGLVSSLQKESAANAALAVTAASHVATIQAVEELASDGSRKDTIVTLAAVAAANALPKINQSDLDRVKSDARRMLDEKDTTIADLQKKYADAQALIESQKSDITKAQSEVVDKTNALEALKKLPPKIVVQVKEKIIDEFTEYKWWIAGAFCLIGVGFIVIGSLMGRALLTAKGVLVIVIALLAGSIPTEYYLAALGAIIVIAIIYIVRHWHTEKTVADNAVGIIQEVKQDGDSNTVALVKQKAKEYWGTSAKQVAKADAMIAHKLKAMNFT